MAQKNAQPIEIKATEKKVSPYEKIMHQRWIASNQFLPAIDKQDIRKEVPFVNGN